MTDGILPSASDEVSAIKQRYKLREQNAQYLRNLYSPLNPYENEVRQERERALIHWANHVGMLPLHDKKLLEIGCGRGFNLIQFMLLGFAPENLAGNELLDDFIADARKRLPPAVSLHLGDASALALPPESFDVIYQSVVFTSILDDSFQQRLASKMWEMVKPGGGILWYDFIYDNPRNRNVRGMPVRKVKALFPKADIKVWKVTLAPPLGRRVAAIHRNLYSLFNAFPFLRSHVLCWIHKPHDREP